MTRPLLTCADPLNPRRADPQFAAEAALARESGARVVLLDHDALLAGRAEEAVARVARELGPVHYRGWMVPSARYRELATALEGRGSPLATTPAAYRTAHELPGWYRVFEPVTPRSVWLPVEPGTVPEPEALAGLAARLGPGPGIVKDYVKSRKHEWDEACFIPDLADTAALAAVVRRFVELQGESLAGGVVLRAFEEFTGREVRVWWVDGAPALATAHPDTPDAEPGGGTEAVAPLVRALGCPFVTTDLVRHRDGRWRVVEVGDGQVSGLPEGADPRELLDALLQRPGR